MRGSLRSTIVVAAAVAAVLTACSALLPSSGTEAGSPQPSQASEAASAPTASPPPPASASDSDPLMPSATAAAPTGTPSPTAPALPPWQGFDQAVVTLQAPDGAATALPVYVAVTPQARQRGLMGRPQLRRDAGMLFVFEAEGRGSFWMKDTLIPLSIAFFDDEGRFVDALDMTPCSADPCPSYVPDGDYSAAIEVNQGLLDDLGVGPGWRLELPPNLRRGP